MLSFDYHFPPQSGFTLIELMITISIVGILTAVALPMYQDYTTKAKLSEVILAATSCRISVIDVIQSSSSLNLSIFLPNACESIHTKYVKNITVSANGIITVHANESQLSSLTPSTNLLTLAPIQTGSNQLIGITGANETIASWRCGSVVDGTTIPSRYLPKSCKGNN
ncbi:MULTISPECIES: pilin [unclassified Psychrobacter]|uniref:pilin n=1 Tax=unclassified Psychrobacter TaxID=196806 RepID=UPI0025ED93EF|nr:pilin [Psychrobacter sp. B29-1]|tara:strand:- start:259 stop:762 length:504 start_codon:yes stop_codon:yes gene_type:complete